MIVTYSTKSTALQDKIISRFNEEVKQHYSFIDRERGYILVPDGPNGEKQAQLMTLAVGSVSNTTHPFSDIREITELAAEDRRRGLGGAESNESPILTSW